MSSRTGILGTGGAAAAGVAPAIGIISPETAAQVDIISGMTLPEVALVAETQEIESTYDMLQTYSLIAGPLGYIAAPLILDPLEKAQKAETIKKYVKRTAALPSYEPTPAPVYQPSIYVPPDPAHPATDPFLGGR